MHFDNISIGQIVRCISLPNENIGVLKIGGTFIVLMKAVNAETESESPQTGIIVSRHDERYHNKYLKPYIYNARHFKPATRINTKDESRAVEYMSLYPTCEDDRFINCSTKTIESHVRYWQQSKTIFSRLISL